MGSDRCSADLWPISSPLRYERFLFKGGASIGQFAEHIQEHHLVHRTRRRAGDARVSNDNCQALGTRNGYIYPVAVEDEGKDTRP